MDMHLLDLHHIHPLLGCEQVIVPPFTSAPCSEGKCSVDFRKQARHQKMEIPSLTVFLFVLCLLICVCLPLRPGPAANCIWIGPFETAAISKRGKHNERHMQMKRDRKAESTQAATVSSHSYEMLSFVSQSFRVYPSSDNKQVLKLYRLAESF